MKLYIFTFFLVTFCYSLTGQEQAVERNSIESQFDEIFRTSSNYNRYKVISKVRFQKLKQNVVDSLSALHTIILEKENLLKTKEAVIKSTQEKIYATQTQLDELSKKENSISFFGKDLKRGTFSFVNGFIIILLLFGLFYFLYSFINSNVLTKEAQNNLIDLEQEFDLHKKKSLINEQKLRRLLQDEINKQKK